MVTLEKQAIYRPSTIMATTSCFIDLYQQKPVIDLDKAGFEHLNISRKFTNVVVIIHH